MPEFETCRECGGVFAFLARGVCGTCLEKAESDFELVRDWLRENGGGAIGSAAEATGVDKARIVRWISEGRIEQVSAEDRVSPQGMLERDEQRRRLIASMAGGEGEEAAAPDADKSARRMTLGLPRRRGRS